MGALLIVVGGFLLGGSYSVWQQAGGSQNAASSRSGRSRAAAAAPDARQRARRTRWIAIVLAVCAILAVGGGILRLA